eukprot:5437786-Prymnesium_polylepis.1
MYLIFTGEKAEWHSSTSSVNRGYTVLVLLREAACCYDLRAGSALHYALESTQRFQDVDFGCNHQHRGLLQDCLLLSATQASLPRSDADGGCRCWTAVREAAALAYELAYVLVWTISITPTSMSTPRALPWRLDSGVSSSGTLP